MLGWEFPPYFTGGVGVVCHELTKGLAKKGVEVTYVMPHGPMDATSDHVKLLIADREMKKLGVKTKRVDSLLKTPYISKEEYAWNYGKLFGGKLMGERKGNSISAGYGETLIQEMFMFAQALLHVVEDEEFDVIHAHDWTTVPAALALKRATGKPMILHAHITEFDKTGGEHADPDVYRIEYEGFHGADIVIAVSNFVKHRLMNSYYVPEEKIRVVHNTVEFDEKQLEITPERLGENDRIVLTLGRVTLQKGIDYFLDAARKVSMIMPNVKFIVAGTGDMLPRMVERAAEYGIGHKVIFTGFVTRDEGDRLYRMADLFVMPSVSEPFGIVPLEAMQQGTPVIVSKQSGVSEVIKHALKVDFWNTDDIASKIIASLTYAELHGELKHHGTMEVRSFTWETPAEHCIHIYEEAMRGSA